MRFSPYSFYRHRRALDTDIQVVKVAYCGPKYTKLKVNFVNRDHTDCFQAGAYITIKKDEYKNWAWV